MADSWARRAETNESTILRVWDRLSRRGAEKPRGVGVAATTDMVAVRCDGERRRGGENSNETRDAGRQQIRAKNFAAEEIFKGRVFPFPQKRVHPR